MTLVPALLVSLALASAPAQRDMNWPSFRGPGARGIAEGYPTVSEWDVASGKNILWRTPVPGLAHSSPVIWGDRVFVTTAVPKGGGQPELKVGLYGSVESVPDEGEQQFQVVCLDRKDGHVLWTQTAFEGKPRYARHPKGSFAASSPAVDGERVVAFFGTEGLYAYDHSGKLLWKRDLGDLDAGWYVMPAEAQWGFSSSPVLHEGLVIVQADVQKGSFLAALKASDGSDVWRVDRDDLPTFGAPTVDVREGRSQVLVNGYKHMGGYDLATGKELWKVAGGGDIPVPTPIVAHDLVFLTNAHGRMAPILAVDAMASGTLTLDPAAEGAIGTRWCDQRLGAYMQTPLVVGEFLYVCKDTGNVTCFDAKTGEIVYDRERMGDGTSGFTSSGVAADGKLYFASEEGEVFVLEEGFEFKVLARNALGEPCMATPAIAGGVLYYRTRDHLTAIGAKS